MEFGWLSKGRPAGRGVGFFQANQLFDKLVQSRAARTGLLSELSDCELFIPGIGPDKISDVTTNIIRRDLIRYTQIQCELHCIPLVGEVASGMLWDIAEARWTNQYVKLPVVDDKKIVLVPKASVRWNLAFSSHNYYNNFVLEFLQAQHLNQHTALVETLKNGAMRVTKKSLKEVHPLSKEYLAAFSENNPRVLQNYKKLLAVSNGLPNDQLDGGVDEAILARALIEELPRIVPGNATANQFHEFMIGTLELIFYPDLIYPVKEDEINEGRKRIDISFTNNASSGFFYRRRAEARCNASRIMVECKNYQMEIANPELDQLAGRFSPNRGRLGFLIGRSFDNRDRFVARCRDTAQADNGFIIPLADKDIIHFLGIIADGRRTELDRDLEARFASLIN